MKMHNGDKYAMDEYKDWDYDGEGTYGLLGRENAIDKLGEWKNVKKKWRLIVFAGTLLLLMELKIGWSM